MSNRLSLTAAALAVPMCLLALPAGAQTTDAWRFQASIYAYLPTMSGSTAFPQSGSGSGSSASVDAEDILGNLVRGASGRVGHV